MDHVVTLRLAVDEEVETDFLLELDDEVNFLLDEVVVFGLLKQTLAELGTGSTNLGGLLEQIVQLSEGA